MAAPSGRGNHLWLKRSWRCHVHVCVARPRSPAPAMPLTTLATVELQLCMQCLDLKSLLSCARCCRLTLVAASAPFSWRALSPLLVKSDAFLHRTHVRRTLVRFADIELEIAGPQLSDS